MTIAQEDKQLLLADLCARLPYGVNVQTKASGGCITEGILWSIDYSDAGTFIYHNGSTLGYDTNEDIIKPYLRPMSSMTEDEKEKLKTFFDAEEVTSDSICYLEGGTLVEYLSRIQYSFCSEIIDWLNTHHFDYRDLIKRGLALEAPKGMYN